MKVVWYLTLLTAMMSFSGADAAEIKLIYPRTVSPLDSFIYDEKYDSTFIFGNIQPPQGYLTVNSHHVETDEFGAFLAFLPLRHGDETKSWNLNLIQQGDTTELTFPYYFKDEMAGSAPDTIQNQLPAIFEITQPYSHIRTTADGSYYLFPAVGTKLLAFEEEGRFLSIKLGNTTAAIEKRFVEISADSLIQPRFLGDGECSFIGDQTICSFELSEPSVWRSGLSADFRTLEVLLYDVVSKLDRIRFDINDPLLEDITWRQEADGLHLNLNFNAPIRRGFAVDYREERLEIKVRHPFPSSQKRLKNKVIVIDAGHGGEADGAIGPLGNKEKDIVLHWAKMLAKALERKRAVVVLTREFDEYKSLYDRIEIARGVNADFFVSLHANGLPDGINPATRSGTGTYYYQSLSRNAAERIHWHLLRAGGLEDDGLWDANFAVARPTEFPSVLIEAAYLMHPKEERLLLDDGFLSRMSNAIIRGLEEYFRE